MAEQRFVTHALGNIGFVVASAAGGEAKQDAFDPIPGILKPKAKGIKNQVLKDLLAEGRVPAWVRSLLVE